MLWSILYVDIDQGQGIHLSSTNIKLHKMKNEKKLCGFSYYKNMANFEAFL